MMRDCLAAPRRVARLRAVRAAAGLAALAVVLGAAPAWAASCRLERVAKPFELLERRAKSGAGGGWLLRRRTEPSRFAAGWVDGVIVVGQGSPLRLRGIRRRDGDHRVALGGEGREPKPFSELSSALYDIRREQMAGHRLLSPEGKELALLYAPVSARLNCTDCGEEFLIELKRWEDEDREPRTPFVYRRPGDLP